MNDLDYKFSVASVAIRKVCAKRLGLTFSSLPFAMPDFTLSMICPSRLEDDAAHRWFRGVLTDCASASLQ